MSETLQSHLFNSARRWAETALDAYSGTGDADFAVHHMAVSVEHLSKSYLASFDDVLLAPDKPTVDDLLILAGREDKVEKGRAGLRTIGGNEAQNRAEKLLKRKPRRPDSVKLLRDSRNGITHLGWRDPANTCRDLLAAGVMFLDDLLDELPQSAESFWGRHHELSKQLVEESVSELQIRYAARIRQAQERYDRRLPHLPQSERTKAFESLASLPMFGLTLPITCPACGNPGSVQGREWMGEYGEEWFLPRLFVCQVCELEIPRDELELAGITMRLMRDEEEDPDWEPDFS
ncbi:hypothetical protein [Streptomyces sp. NPDC005322]|uniref:hypothetical protein n=1 Tax=Streptomyces sp. NPDC005322 TaxID=3157032 RepID=UPI0033BD6C13